MDNVTAFTIPKQGYVPQRRADDTTTLKGLREDIVNSFRNTFTQERMCDRFPEVKDERKIGELHISKIIVGFDSIQLRSLRLGWYAWIEFKDVKNKDGSPVRLASSIDAPLDGISDLDYDTIEDLESIGRGMAEIIRDDILEITKGMLR